MSSQFLLGNAVGSFTEAQVGKSPVILWSWHSFLCPQGVFGHVADTGQRFRACLVHNSASSPPFPSPTRNSVHPISTTLGTCSSSPVLHSSMFVFSATYSKETPQPFPKVSHPQMLHRESHREATGINRSHEGSGSSQ